MWVCGCVCVCGGGWLLWFITSMNIITIQDLFRVSVWRVSLIFFFFLKKRNASAERSDLLGDLFQMNANVLFFSNHTVNFDLKKYELRLYCLKGEPIIYSWFGYNAAYKATSPAAGIQCISGWQHRCFLFFFQSWVSFEFYYSKFLKFSN